MIERTSVFKQEPYKLPEGWKWVRLGRICSKPQYGYTTPAIDKPVGPKLLRITDIQEGKVDWNSVPYCKINEDKFKKYEIKKNDIFFARTGATTGKSFLIEKEPPPAVFASYLIRVQLLENIVFPKFVYLFFQSPWYWTQIVPRGGAQPNMNARKLVNLLIPLPPPEEQHRIIKRIEQLLSKVDQAKRLRKQAKEEAERIMQAVLHEVFSRAEEKGWKWAILKEIVFIRKDTLIPKDHPEEEFELYSIPAYHETGRPEIKLGKEIRSAKVIVQPNDCLFGKLNPRLPKVWLVEPFKGRRQIASTELFPLVPKDRRILTKFLFWMLRTPYFQDKMISKVLATTKSRERLNQNDILNESIPLPPLKEQEKIVAYLDKIKETLESIKKLQQKTDEELEKLTPAILDKAFKGEI